MTATECDVSWRACGTYLPNNSSKAGLLDETRVFLLTYGQIGDLAQTRRSLVDLVDDELRSDATLTFYHLDALTIVVQSTSRQEQRREALLNDPTKRESAAGSLLRVWADAVHEAITDGFAASPPAGRPVVVLRGLAALHPLGTPTGMMEALAEEEPRDPASGQIVPIVLLIPGIFARRRPAGNTSFWPRSASGRPSTAAKRRRKG
jgi:hypothetical protein